MKHYRTRAQWAATRSCRPQRDGQLFQATERSALGGPAKKSCFSLGIMGTTGLFLASKPVIQGQLRIYVFSTSEVEPFVLNTPDSGPWSQLLFQSVLSKCLNQAISSYPSRAKHSFQARLKPCGRG